VFHRKYGGDMMAAYLKNGWLVAAVMAALILVLVGYAVGAGSLGVGQLTGAGGKGRPDPAGAQFVLNVDGQIVGYFSKVGGIGSETEIVEHRFVDDRGNELSRLVPGRLTWTPITLQRGFVEGAELSQWRDNVVNGNIDQARKNVTITMMDARFQEVASWELNAAWPVKLVYSNLDDATGNLVEQIVLVHEGLYRSK
jgi:phage tail-like protein